MVGTLNGKTALVSGGTSGIGLAVVRRFVAEGAHVFVTGRRQQALDALREEFGDHVTPVQADATEPAGIETVFRAVAARGAGLDAVHVNAGIGEFKPLAEVTAEDIDETFGTNVRATTLTVQGALPFLGKGSAIVVTGSSSASGTEPAFGLYGASKAAVATLTRTWAAELAPRGIRINTVVPGPTETPGLKGLAPNDPDALLAAIASKLPFGRVLLPEEVAAAVLFLVSDESSGMTGSELAVDGGSTIV
ncbi:NAD(P)-dependent dehydrogenase (short-subunit alcohol dehydrogenase family) [Curtobacterium flaccumfaciens]|jgi:NAD(P)-dependent dehydrogenase (short-subunit alcohol dehydrogenase family)|uniref:NAD(P)-dependent dehydrogenase (Short-subunit alcohol dehydrogenase family) n=1 Tax=Curtobacterium flaccumfaciens TaxID=2035 RepID=A0A4R6DCZ0_9MICO|nr:MULTISPECIES: SDR family oxidoreductase [Curtobacterium]OII07001.1 short-chain dehydrogenase [Curtobacterium sp. MCBA15_008]TDN42381.1 NAD(P)-dependent dehydrogenase (short-subunit alcohol dehydrogenase family) [Curtobacterium flaccumfaciens]